MGEVELVVVEVVAGMEVSEVKVVEAVVARSRS